MKIGETYEIQIENVSPRGEGIGKIKGYSIFVANAKLGETVKAKVFRTDYLCADAELVPE